ncbi:MAG: glutathione S-transferase C-terminal domain-containing protein, partial [Pseudomonadota bacterium]|nr:glutathione S-transferase C-terminal domain-containing protein [Pseudomonadota bacterium]
PSGCAAMRVWTKAVDEGIHEGVVALSFSAMFRERMKGMTDEQRMRQFRNIGDPVRRDRDRAVFEQGVESSYVFNAIAVYETAFSKLEKVLVDGRDWIMGDQYTLAEINFAPYIARLQYMGLLEIWIENRPKVSAWWNRIKARLAYQRGVSDRLTTSDIEPMQRFGGAIHLRVAELRQDYLREFVITD